MDVLVGCAVLVMLLFDFWDQEILHGIKSICRYVFRCGVSLRNLAKLVCMMREWDLFSCYNQILML